MCKSTLHMPEEVECVGRIDRYLVEFADLDGRICSNFEQHFAIDFGRIVLGATDKIVAFAPVDDGFERAPNLLCIDFGSDIFLNRHDFVHTPLFFGTAADYAESAVGRRFLESEGEA